MQPAFWHDVLEPKLLKLQDCCRVATGNELSSANNSVVFGRSTRAVIQFKHSSPALTHKATHQRTHARNKLHQMKLRLGCGVWAA